MNTMGYKMNNKLTNVMGNKFSNRMHTMGSKMMPIINSSDKYSTYRVMVPSPSIFDRKIMDTIPMMGNKKQLMRKRLTK
jgi:hypothetical protein